MRRFVIEREIPGIGDADHAALKGAAQKSNGVLDDLGTSIQWVHSYVAQDKTFCVYLAESEELIHQHAEQSGFPASKITEIKQMFDPTSAGEEA
jgi:hypothetical protein